VIGRLDRKIVEAFRHYRIATNAACPAQNRRGSRGSILKPKASASPGARAAALL
jgi:hypothetical protein